MLLFVSFEFILSIVRSVRATAGPITLQSVGVWVLKLPARTEYWFSRVKRSQAVHYLSEVGCAVIAPIGRPPLTKLKPSVAELTVSEDAKLSDRNMVLWDFALLSDPCFFFVAYQGSFAPASGSSKRRQSISDQSISSSIIGRREEGRSARLVKRAKHGLAKVKRTPKDAHDR